MAFKIASGYIDIEATYSRRDLLATARRAGRDAARGFNQGFREQAAKKNFNPFKQVASEADSAGRSMGRRMSRSFRTEFNKNMAMNASGVTTTVNRTMTESARKVNTKEPARRISNSFAANFDKSMKENSKRFTDSFKKHMLNSPDIQWWMVYILLGAVAFALPFVGAALSTGFVLLGGGIMTALGISIAKNAPKVKSAFKSLKEDVRKDLEDMTKPYEDMLVNLADHMRGTWDALSPSFERFFDESAPTLDKFFNLIFKHFESWDGVIDEMTNAFNNLITAWMPDLKNDLDDIRDEFESIFKTVAENPEEFVKVLNFIVGLILNILRLIDWLSKKWVAMSNDWDSSNSKIKDGLFEIGKSLNVMFGPIVMLIGFVFSLVGAFTDLVTLDFDGFKSNVSRMIQTLGRFLFWPVEVITILIDALMRFFRGDEWGTRAQDNWAGFWTAIGDTVGDFLTFVLMLPITIAKFFTRNFPVIERILWSVVGPWIAPFVWIYERLIGNSIIPDMVTGILGWLGRLSPDGSSILSRMSRTFLGIFGTLNRNGVSQFSSMTTGILSQVTRMDSSTMTKIRSFKSKLDTEWKKIKSAGTDAAKSLVSGWGSSSAKFGPAVSPGVSRLVGVINAGVIALWDKFAPKLGLSKVGKVNFRGLARGGILPGQSSYRDGDDQLVPMRQGEGVYVSEAMRDPYERARLYEVNRAAMKGQSLAQFRDGRFGGPSPHYQGAYGDQKILDKGLGFARGGIIPTALATLGRTPWDDVAGSLKDKISGPMNGLKGQFPDKSSSFMGVPYHVLKSLIPRVVKVMGSADEKAFAIGGGATGEAKKVIQKAGSFVGRVGGRPNQFSNAMGMPYGPWCAAFVSEVFRMVNATGSINGITARNGGAAVATFNSRLKSVPHSQRRAGDLATYRGNGHINTLADRNTTIGGNESNRVRKQTGYVNSATRILRPKYKGSAADGTSVNKGMGTHDVGGLFPDRSVAHNRSGKAEVVQTLDQIQAIAAMLEASQGSVTIQNLYVEANKIDEVQKLIDTMNKVRVTSRKGGVGYNGEEI